MAYDFIEETGIIEADTSAIQAEVEAEYLVLFGDDLDLDPETPEGILISAETAARSGLITNNALLANQINPNLAGGVFLDDLWALLGGTRDSATASTFSALVDVTGEPGAVIPIGSKAATAAGDEFETLGNVMLDGSGDGVVAFASVVLGPIPAAIGALNVIVTGVLGWETVSNSVAATLGTATQSDISARMERVETLGKQGSSTNVAIFSEVRGVAGVTSLVLRENFTDTTITPTPPDNITLVPHSVWICADGGSDADVASALLGAKSSGSNWNNGNSAIPVSEVVLDPTSGQSYTVLFDRPDLIPVLYEVTIQPSSVSNAVSIVEQAILNYAAGLLDGQPGLVAGADVSPFEAAGAINIAEPALVVTAVRVTIAAVPDLQPTTITIELFEKATVVLSSITVIVS